MNFTCLNLFFYFLLLFLVLKFLLGFFLLSQFFLEFSFLDPLLSCDYFLVNIHLLVFTLILLKLIID